MQKSSDSLQIGRGEFVFRQGEIGDSAYLIEAGGIEISALRNGATVVIATLGPGDLFGEMSLLDGRPRSATARALEDCALLPITRKLIETKLANADPLTRLLLKLVLSRRREREDEDVCDLRMSHAQTMQMIADELTIANDLHRALQRFELEVHFQPIVRLADGGLAGFEALARWNRNGQGYMPPPKFIAAAEESGLILPLGRDVLRRACAALTRLEEAHAALYPASTPLFMSINVSAGQLYESGEAQALVDIIRDSGADPAQIKLEITETVLLHDPQAAARSMELLTGHGLRLAIDDFGTGYSGLNYLHRYPLETLKIDRSFVSQLPDDDGCLRLVRAILGLAREMRLRAVAEGVETPAQEAALRHMGCEFGQGYLFARPRCEQETLDWIGARPARAAG